MVENKESKWLKPSYRYRLRALITLRGSRSIADFARKLEIPSPLMSRIVSGWEFPSESLAKKMAEALQVNLEGMQGLLNSNGEEHASFQTLSEVRDRYIPPELAELPDALTSRDVSLLQVRQVELLEEIRDQLKTRNSCLGCEGKDGVVIG